MTLQQAQMLLSSFPLDDEHHTVQHSKDVLYVGQQIAGTHLTESLKCALLLHDIGHFFEDSKNSFNGHGMLARLFLENQGCHVPEILLPVTYHEANEYLEQMCSNDILFQMQNEKRKKVILWNCRIVCEADIISHMRDILQEPTPEIDFCSDSFFTFLKSGHLPTTDLVVYPNDRILYLLCGLSLIHLQESNVYLNEKNMVPKLISRLPAKYRTLVSNIIQTKYRL